MEATSPRATPPAFREGLGPAPRVLGEPALYSLQGGTEAHTGFAPLCKINSLTGLNKEVWGFWPAQKKKVFPASKKELPVRELLWNSFISSHVKAIVLSIYRFPSAIQPKKAVTKKWRLLPRQLNRSRFFFLLQHIHIKYSIQSMQRHSHVRGSRGFSHQCITVQISIAPTSYPDLKRRIAT